MDRPAEPQPSGSRRFVPTTQALRAFRSAPGIDAARLRHDLDRFAEPSIELR